jgi:hypothetical protein
MLTLSSIHIGRVPCTRQTNGCGRAPPNFAPCWTTIRGLRDVSGIARIVKWLRGHATPDPGEMETKTRKATLPDRLRWYRKNRWLRGPATPDSCDWSSGQFPGSLPNGLAGDFPLKRMRSADASPDRKPRPDPKSGSRHRLSSSIPAQGLCRHAEGPEESATHAFAVRKTCFLRHDVNRVPPLLHHEPGSF